MRVHARPSSLVLVLLALATWPAHAEEAEEGGPVVVEEGRTVSIEYTLKLDDGSTADSNIGGDPLTFQQGESQILPALEQELAGLEVDDSKQVTLEPEKGYGPVNPDAFQRVPADQIPEGAREVGAQLVAQSPSGQRQIVRVHEVSGDDIVLDLNHPLAGETLHFDVKILSIE